MGIRCVSFQSEPTPVFGCLSYDNLYAYALKVFFEVLRDSFFCSNVKRSDQNLKYIILSFENCIILRNKEWQDHRSP